MPTPHVRPLLLLSATLLPLLAGCTTSSESAQADAMTKMVGVYEPPPAGVQPARLGIPAFAVKDVQDRSSAGQMSELAADQATTLAVRTERFDVIERAQLSKLLDEQGLEGIVTAGEMAKPAQVRGVDYLLLGKVTNFRVKSEKSSSGVSLGRLPIPGAGGAAAGIGDWRNTNTTVKVDCGIELRLVDPTTGAVAAAEFSEYSRTDTIGSLGIAILGANAQSSADLKVDEDSQGKILRLALDECMRKMLPRIDRVLKARSAKAAEMPKTEEAAK